MRDGETLGGRARVRALLRRFVIGAGLQIIEENKIFVVEASTPAESMPNPMTIEDVESDSVICVVDSGIASANGIFDKLIVDKYPLLPTGSVDATYDHGTFVASRCVFGDSIDNCLGSHSLKPYCKIVDAQVFGIDSGGVAINPSEMHLRFAIEKLVTNYDGLIKVYNLSLGVPAPISDFNFSELEK